MDKVYIVTSGCYSDYRIDIVFSEKKLADEYVAVCGGEIEEWELNAACPKLKLFYVFMYTNGDVKETPWEKDGRYNHRPVEVYQVSSYPSPIDLLRIEVTCDTPEEAIKIANEARIGWLYAQILKIASEKKRGEQ